MVVPKSFGITLPFSGMLTHHVARYNTPIHIILSTAPQLIIIHKALGKLLEDDYVMPKHVELAYMISKLNE
jgi:hypothetical protein